MTLKFALKTIAIAAALTFAGASQAINISTHSSTTFSNSAMDLNGRNAVRLIEWDVHTTQGSFLAFCIEPDVGGHSTDTSYVATVGDPTTAIMKLYETSYADVVAGGTAKAAAFQLALWEMMDTQNFTTGSFKLPTTGYSRAGNEDIALDAYLMVQEANDYKGLLNSYKYTTYTSAVGVDGMHTSQTVLSVSPVPEADAWAMLAAGLGLIGFMGRRQSRRGEKFAA